MERGNIYTIIFAYMYLHMYLYTYLYTYVHTYVCMHVPFGLVRFGGRRGGFGGGNLVTWRPVSRYDYYSKSVGIVCTRVWPTARGITMHIDISIVSPTWIN